jgi:hypothetical protein
VKRSLVIVTICALAGWAGAWTALRQIPPEMRRPAPQLPIGARYATPSEIAGAANPRDLRDWHFAKENGMTLASLADNGRIILLKPGTPVVVERGDLALVQVRLETSGEMLWVRASDLDRSASELP